MVRAVSVRDVEGTWSNGAHICLRREEQKLPAASRILSEAKSKREARKEKKAKRAAEDAGAENGSAAGKSDAKVSRRSAAQFHAFPTPLLLQAPRKRQKVAASIPLVLDSDSDDGSDSDNF